MANTKLLGVSAKKVNGGVPPPRAGANQSPQVLNRSAAETRSNTDASPVDAGATSGAKKRCGNADAYSSRAGLVGEYAGELGGGGVAEELYTAVCFVRGLLTGAAFAKGRRRLRREGANASLSESALDESLLETSSKDWTGATCGNSATELSAASFNSRHRHCRRCEVRSQFFADVSHERAAD